MLLQVSSPVRAILDRWIYEGELEDGYQEVSYMLLWFNLYYNNYRFDITLAQIGQL